MKINWLILLSVTLVQPFMLYAAETASASAATTIAIVPLTQDQIATLAQQAIANCMTPQAQRYVTTLQNKLAVLLIFRSQLQAENLRDQSAKLIIHQQRLDHGCIQADQHDDTTASSSTSNKRWSQLFTDKLLTKSANEQAEISWTHETASLLVQYWQAFNAYNTQKRRESNLRKLAQIVASESIELTADTILAPSPKKSRNAEQNVPLAASDRPYTLLDFVQDMQYHSSSKRP